MPFLCCCRKPKTNDSDDTAMESYTNYDAQIKELQSKLEVKETEIQKLNAQNKYYATEVKELKRELEESRKSNQELKRKEEEKDASSDVATKKIQNLTEEMNQRESTFLMQKEDLNKKISEKDQKIKEMENVLHSVMPAAEPAVNASAKNRKKAIHGNKIETNVTAEKTNKKPEEREFLREAISSNDFFKHLSRGQASLIIDYMKFKGFPQNDTLIKEGTDGDRFYILYNGECQVTQGSKELTVLRRGTVFGELAILYNCKRTASVKAMNPVKVWYLQREVYQFIMMTAVKNEFQEIAELVKDTPLKRLPQKKFAKIAGVVNQEEYSRGESIVLEGEVGKTFYIIKEGEVDVTKNEESSNGQSFVRTLQKGEFFGELALQKNGDRRTANIIAKSEKVTCYTLDRDNFNQLIGDAAKILWPDSKDSVVSQLSTNELALPTTPRPSHHSSRSVSSTDRSLENVELRDFEFIAILGAGGFGKVELVRLSDRDKTYALKCMKKIHIVETKQEEHVYSEKEIMIRCHCPFIVKLYRTYKNNKYVYMLMEACLGGELWTHLRDKGRFSDHRAKFYTACVLEALDYLHQRGIVYRDLKPENLLLTNNGYVKLVDFGFAKSIASVDKTWTFCGTPQYVSPEIILNQGHDVSADYWALGILIFEFLTGNPPFDSTDPMRTYRMALRGIDAVEFPVYIKKPAQNLIRRLCREKPSERLGNLKGGINEIKIHKWFTGFDWNGLRNSKLQADYIPVVNGNADTRNFENFEREYEKVPSETSGWDKDF